MPEMQEQLDALKTEIENLRSEVEQLQNTIVELEDQANNVFFDRVVPVTDITGGIGINVEQSGSSVTINETNRVTAEDFQFYTGAPVLNQAYVAGGILNIHGLTPPITVAATTLTLAGDPAWAVVQHQWGTSTAAWVVISGSDIPTSDGTYMNWPVAKYTNITGTTYGLEQGNRLHIGSIPWASALQ